MPTKNIKVNYGAVGDGQIVTRTLTIASSSANLSATASTWVSGDVGKTIAIPGADTLGRVLTTTILTFTDATHVVLADAAVVALSAVSTTFTFGTDDWLAFENFRTFAQGQAGEVDLTIPAGVYILDSFVHAGANTSPFDGIPNLVVTATGATIPIFRQFYGFRPAAVVGFSESAGTSALVASVSAGATSLTCSTHADASIFPVGRWCCLGGLEWQGTNAHPPNFQYFQYVQIVSANATTGVVTFTPAATQNYLSTWPVSSNVGANVPLGPAALYLLVDNNGVDTGWDTDTTIDGLTIQCLADNTQVSVIGRRVTLKNMSFVECHPSPSASKYISIQNTAIGTSSEMDKVVDYCEYVGCTISGNIAVQSATINQLVFDSTTITQSLTGTVLETIIRNGCDFNSLKFGTIYGTAGRVSIDGTCTIRGVEISTDTQILLSRFALSGGALTFDGVGDVMHFGAPGAILFPSSDHTFMGFPSLVSEVHADGSGKFVLGTSFPDAISSLSGTVYIFQHPCTSVTVASGAVGCVEILDLATAAPNKPLYSHLKRTSDFSVGQSVKLWGRLRDDGVHRIMVNVVTPYTGAGTCFLHVGGQFNNAPMVDTDGSNTTFGAGAIINAKVPGIRYINASTVTALSGDTLLPTGGAWFAENITPQLDIVSAEPSIIVEAQTDQGIALGGVVPLRLRLHS